MSLFDRKEDALLNEIKQLVQGLYKLPARIHIQFKGKAPNMPGQMTDVQSISAIVGENDAAGNPVTLDPAKLTWSVGDPTIASLTQNQDGSATFKGLKIGTTSVGVTDSSNGLSAQDTLTVTADVATSLTIKFGTPS